MRGSMIFLPGWSRPDCQKTALSTFFVFFFPQLLQLYSGLSMVYFKENYNFTMFRGGGGGVQPIPGAGAGGPNANSRNP